MKASDIDRLIEQLESRLKENRDNMEEIQKEINRLKLQAFEEDIREQDTRQLLNG
jgi:peptidoglycan hydrolase CwlO-like protein